MTGQTGQPIKAKYGENMYVVNVQSVTVTKYVNKYYGKLINIIFLLLYSLEAQPISLPGH